ncbi:hypothetical protein [Streptomyces sp. NPDC055400]
MPRLLGNYLRPHHPRALRHALYQQHRRTREQQRVRAADQRYLNDSETNTA